MVFEVSSVLLHFLVKELKVLEGGKVEKIYQIGKDTVIFRLYADGKKYNLRFSLPGVVCLTSQEFNAPMLPPGFCMFLRKYLSGARLLKFEQRDFERIVLLIFSSKGETYVLIVELFKPGNLVLCKERDSSLVVINSFSRQRFKDRVIQARSEYVFPPALINPLVVSPDELVLLVDKSDRNLVKTLASRLGLGGVYAEEILARCDLDKEKKSISLDEAKVLVGAFGNFFSESLSPVKSDSNVYPFPLLTKSGSSISSISEGIDSLSTLEKGEVKSSVIKKKKDKVASLVDIQEGMVKKFEGAILDNQEKGEFIYSNYQDFKVLIEEANNIRKKVGLDGLEKELKKNPRFKSLNKKDKEIVLKF